MLSWEWQHKVLVTKPLRDETSRAQMVNTFLLVTPNSDAAHTSTVVWQRFTFPEDTSRNRRNENTGGLKIVGLCVCESVFGVSVWCRGEGGTWSEGRRCFFPATGINYRAFALWSYIFHLQAASHWIVSISFFFFHLSFLFKWKCTKSSGCKN